MLPKMAANATICSTFEVQYGTSTSSRMTAIGHLGYLKNRSRDFAHASRCNSGLLAPGNRGRVRNVPEDDR